MPNNSNEHGGNEGLTFEEQLEALSRNFLENLKGLCAREGKSLKETVEGVHESVSELALRIRTYVPNSCNTALYIAEKEMPAELRVGGKQMKGQFMHWAKANIYKNEQHREELERLVEQEKAELRSGVRTDTFGVKKARNKALKCLEKSVSLS